ncbi:hypothetical protein DDB_G0284815 [Dictyostelium discoideum AX4]|uniref:Uncharacterized protein n=1 Tax=Dictyostelium discoideum TaxID=44689 RepID=Q54P35_DICDI|nr:hypothetical protein DDB_G0284815 [Dictyostelium discoideum AX4]EAL65060.1 hypothetical protein DDB_G0284815 [Dictyostelium discoideum AX4]|eukprot:XP_638423.1 hypothetical protein DDB_G0284815 [Dictyostelium discoideum AX4]
MKGQLIYNKNNNNNNNNNNTNIKIKKSNNKINCINSKFYSKLTKMNHNKTYNILNLNKQIKQLEICNNIYLTDNKNNNNNNNNNNNIDNNMDHTCNNNNSFHIYDNYMLSLKKLTINVIKILIHFKQFTSISIKDISNYLNVSTESISFIIKILYILEIVEKDSNDETHYIWKGLYDNQDFIETIDYISNSKSNFVTNHSEPFLNIYDNYHPSINDIESNNPKYNKDIGSILHQFLKNLIKRDYVSFLHLKNNIYLIDSQYYHIVNISKVLYALGLISIEVSKNNNLIYFKWIGFIPKEQ